jgi:hypothetical protein
MNGFRMLKNTSRYLYYGMKIVCTEHWTEIRLSYVRALNSLFLYIICINNIRNTHSSSRWCRRLAYAGIFQIPSARAFIGRRLKNWVTTGWMQFLARSHCPIRFISTRLNSTDSEIFRTARLAGFQLSWVELNWIVSVITLRRAVWSLLRSDSTQLSWPVELSWVGSGSVIEALLLMSFF